MVKEITEIMIFFCILTNVLIVAAKVHSIHKIHNA